MPNNQRGSIPLLLLVSVIGLLGFLIVIFVFPFKDPLFSTLFSKPSTFANTINPTTTATFGVMQLSSTFNSIGIEVPFVGDVFNKTAQATVEYKKSSETNYKKALDLWPTYPEYTATFRPVSDISNGWNIGGTGATTRFGAVDETSANSTDFIASTQDGATQTFGLTSFGDVDFNYGYKATVTVNAKTTGDDKVKIDLLINGTPISSTTETTLTSSYQNYTVVFNSNWTEAEVKSMQIRLTHIAVGTVNEVSIAQSFMTLNYYQKFALYGSILQLEPDITYDVKVILSDPGQTSGQQTLMGSITTRPDNVPAADTLTPTHFVRSDGNDSNSGTANTPNGAWKSLHKAHTAAPAGAVVQVAPGYYPSANSVNKDLVRSTPITYIAEKPALDDNRNIINHGQHSVIEYGTVTFPNTSTWTKVDLTGPATGQSYRVYKWTSPYSSSYSAIAMGYAETREDLPQRIASWDLKSGTVTDKSGKVWYLKNAADPSDATGWAEVLYNNKMYNFGFATFGADIYVRLPGDLDPNNYFITLTRATTGGPTDGFAFNAPNVRLSGFELRQVGVTLQAESRFGIIDHNLFVSRGLSITGVKPATYGSDHLIQFNKFVDSTLYSATGTDPFISWTFIKSALQLPDGTTSSWSRVGSGSGGGLGAEQTAVSLAGGSHRTVIRFNTIDGLFNGIGSNNTGYNRNSARDTDSYQNIILNVNDDAFEPEQQVINWRIWNNRIENTAVGLSVGPVNYGPLYFFRNTLWRLGGHGNVADKNGSTGTSGQGFKYSGTANASTGRVYVVNNTFWTNSTTSVSGGSQAASGGVNSENFYLRNNIFRMTRYGFDAPGYSGKWNEDYNLFSTTDQTRGMNFGSANKATVSIYRSSSGQGANSNTPILDPTQDFHSLPDNWLTNPEGGDLSLKVGTPLIDSGVVVANITESFSGTAPDLGSVEFGASSPSSSPLSTPASSVTKKPGDTNDDHKVDILDYNSVLSDFGKKNTQNLAGDVDFDSDVDIFDYTLILTKLGT